SRVSNSLLYTFNRSINLATDSILPLLCGLYARHKLGSNPISNENCLNFSFNTTFLNSLLARSTTVRILSNSIFLGTPPVYLNALISELNSVFCSLSNVIQIYFFLLKLNEYRKILNSNNCPC